MEQQQWHGDSVPEGRSRVPGRGRRPAPPPARASSAESGTRQYALAHPSINQSIRKALNAAVRTRASSTTRLFIV